MILFPLFLAMAMISVLHVNQAILLIPLLGSIYFFFLNFFGGTFTPIALAALALSFWIWSMRDAYTTAERTGKETIVIKEVTKQAPNQTYQPEISVNEAVKVMTSHLWRYYINVSSVGSSKFRPDLGVWEFVADTDKGYYLVQVSNKENVVKSEELTERDEWQKKLKPEYKTEE